jgi:hypothetical protein
MRRTLLKTPTRPKGQGCRALPKERTPERKNRAQVRKGKERLRVQPASFLAVIENN